MASVEKYQLKDGSHRYRVRYTLPGTGRRTDKRGFRRKKDADLFLASVEVDKATGSFVSHSAGLVTVAQLAPHWFDSQVGHAYSWKARQESIWRVHVEPRWGHRRVADITPGGVQAWIADQHRDGLSGKTIRQHLGVLQALLDGAVSERRLNTNPARTGIRVPRTLTREKLALTPSQVRALGDAVPDTYSELFWFLVTSGVRFGEAAALTPASLLGGGRVRLSRSYAKVNHESIESDLKGHELRTVAVPSQVEDGLFRVAASRRTEQLLWTAPRKGGPLRPPERGHWLDAAVRRCHDADETFPDHVPVHSLRHTAASLMISSGAHVKTIQRQLGHKSAQMTLDQYGHLMEDDLGVVATAMDSVLFRGGQGVGTPSSQGGPEA